MGVNLYEHAIQPVVDLDTDVVVYVPGYADKGPKEPTLVNSSNFTSLYGASPHIFTSAEAAEVGSIAKNNIFAGRPEKSWLYAKGLVDAGLTVLYHRVNPLNIGIASTAKGVLKITELDGSSTTGTPLAIAGKTFSAQAKNFGKYYSGMVVKFKLPTTLIGNVIVEVLSDSTANAKTLEGPITVSFDPSKNNFIGNVNFAYIDFYTGDPNAAGGSTQVFGLGDLALDSYLSSNPDKKLYAANTVATGDALTLTAPEEFTVRAMEELLEGDDSPANVLLDTNYYQSVTYITSGGYYQSTTAAANMHKVGWKIKAAVATDIGDIVTEENFSTLQGTLTNIGSDTMEKSKAFQFIGADTFVIGGYRVVIPDSYGYLLKLASNLSQAIPAWIPVANNPQGVVSAVATTRPVNKALQELMQDKNGVSVNPIIYKQNVGYTIMGNRTLYPNDGVLGPQSFLNCVLVVNSVERAARRAAEELLIVSTNAQTAFSTFKRAVSKTCEKMLVNGDGLQSFNIIKLKKTQPATLDIAINLVVVEGIEVFNVTISHSIALD